MIWYFISGWISGAAAVLMFSYHVYKKEKEKANNERA